MVEGDALAVRRPPEGPIAGRAAQDLFVVHPRSISVHHGGRSVEGQPALGTIGNGHDIQVVLPRESQHRGIRRIGQIHGSFRLKREIRILFRRLDTLHLLSFGHHQLETFLVGVPSVVGKGYFLVAEPLISGRQAVELLGGNTAGEEGEGKCHDQSFHTNSSSLKFTRYTFSTARVRAVYSHFRSSGVRKSCQKGLSMKTHRHWPPCDL